jgi:hypothetical protein
MGLLSSLLGLIIMTVIMIDAKYDGHHINVNGASGEFENEG